MASPPVHPPGQRPASAPAQRARLRSFHELMQRRVQRILLVSSLYESFIMSEEGQLHETLLSHFVDLNLGHTPDLIQVPTGQAALELLEEDRDFDLVVSSLVVGDHDANELARAMTERGLSTPVLALAYTQRELADFVAHHETSALDRIFLWQGDVRISLAMVMYVEDRLNVENDTGVRGVPAIIVVEDNVRYYSSFLPVIYAELFRHTHRLLSEDLNRSQKMMRMRARPKVLLFGTYEEAWDAYLRYEEQVLGVITDVQFPRAGHDDPRAGVDLCARVVERRSDVRLVMQSSDPSNRELADRLGASFLLKGSPHLLHQLRDLLVERFGFGDFVFRGPDGREIDRAGDMRQLGEKLRTVPAATIAYHAARNHFSNWLKARTEFGLAERLRPKRLEDFDGPEDLRAHLLRMLEETRLERNRTVIAEFDRTRFEPTVGMTRIGQGSLGGKARGLAFANRIILGAGLDAAFPDVEIYVPPSVVLGTELFDEFLEYDDLRDYATGAEDDESVERRFLEAPFPREAIASLRTFLQRVKYPVAVRSSSLLEDSLSQPFAGVYRTEMLPNNDPELDVRWRQLAAAVKLVYASAFSVRAKSYLGLTSYRLEEEKMAVLLQELVGEAHGARFYPDFGGVARSHSFYPEPGHQAEDGVAAVALGLGRAVVGGDACLRFCPRYPRQQVGFSSVDDALRSSQRDFQALDLGREAYRGELAGVGRHPLETAEEDGTLKWVGSTYVRDDRRIVDGISRAGTRLVSFAQILKHGAFPLAEILTELLVRCSEGTGGPVEIEFAGTMARPGRRARFAFLQLRPLALASESEQVEWRELRDEEILCRSDSVLGNGRLEGLFDVVVVAPEGFQRRRTVEVAQKVARFDALLRKERRPYLLIGVGRWGSSDPSLGIPVGWNQISGARAIVEAGFEDLRVAPSQGTHFFQNLTSSHVGYFTVNPDTGEGWVDWPWIAERRAFGEAGEVRHLRLERPLTILMNGRRGAGVVLKPGVEP